METTEQTIEAPVQLVAAVPREWWVVSTAIQEVVLLLECGRTGAVGIVRDPSANEWGSAFNAPSETYRWFDDTRVELLADDAGRG